MELICSDKKNDCDLFTGEQLEVDSDSIPTTEHMFSDDAIISVRVQLGDNLKPLDILGAKDITLAVSIDTGAGIPQHAQVIRSFSVPVAAALISLGAFYVEDGEVLSIMAYSDNANDTDVACDVRIVDITAEASAGGGGGGGWW